MKEPSVNFRHILGLHIFDLRKWLVDAFWTGFNQRDRLLPLLLLGAPPHFISSFTLLLALLALLCKIES